MFCKTKRKLIALLSVYACLLVVIMACGNGTLTGLSTTGATGTTSGTGGTGGTTTLALTGSSPSGVLAVGTTQATLSFTTNVNATCKYSTFSGVSFASMTGAFTTTGGTAQSATVTGLQNGTTYNYYIKCQDTLGNTSSDYPISFMVASVAGGNTYYVDIAKGSDSNSGSITSPWKYIDTSAVKLQPGDTLYVRGGTYTLSPTNSWGVMYLETRQGADGLPGAIKSIIGYPGETAIINFPIQHQASYWKWQGLTITKSMEIRPWDPWNTMTIPAGNTPPMAHEVPGLWPHDIQVKNNIFAVAPIGQWSGILQTFGSNLLIENNDFTQSRPGSMTSPQNQTTGLYVSSGDNIVVRGNKFAGPSDYISEVYDERRSSSEVFTRWITNVLIEDNIYYCPPGGLQAVNGDPYVSRGLEIGTGNYTKGNNITVRNNVFFGMREELIQVDQGYDNVKIYNNTFFQPVSGTILSTRQFSGVSTNVSVENNIFDLGANYAGASNVNAATGWSVNLNNNLYYPSTPKVNGTTELNPILGDPAFVNASPDPTVADFHLKSGSPAIDRGLTLTEVPNDFDRIARPQGPAYDIGAYEFH